MQYRNRLSNLLSVGIAGLLSVLWSAAFAAPPYDVTVTFDPPTGGDPASAYNLYIDDCAATGPTGPAEAAISSGITLVDLITADGSYDFCIRSENAAGENPDPGPVATVDISSIGLPGQIQNLDIAITCKDGTGATIVCIDSGVTISVTVN